MNLRFWTAPDLEESIAPPRTSPRPVRAVSTMRLRRGNRGASSRMTSSVYRPLCSFGFALRGGRFSVPSEVIRSGGEALRFALRHGLRPSTRAAHFVTGYAREPLRERALCASRNTRSVTRNAPVREDLIHPACTETPRRMRTAQHHERVAQAPRSGEPATLRVDPRSSDPSIKPTGWTLREVGGDAKRCEVRSTSRRTDTATSSRREALRSPKSE